MFFRVIAMLVPLSRSSTERASDRQGLTKSFAEAHEGVVGFGADGNETGGIALPEIAVPLGTHTGWTLRHPAIGGETQRLVFGGATIPFPRTRRERAAVSDPRLSIEERYRSRDDYLERVRRAAAALVSERYLLDEDIELTVALAARAWDHWTA